MKKSLLGLFVLTLVGCQAGPNQTNIELVTAMMDQESYKAQDWDPDRKGNATAMVPPENTIPRNLEHYRFGPADAEKAGRENKNPYTGKFDADVIKLGKVKYEIYCGLCHGMAGAGDGQIAVKMLVKPPSLLSDKVKKMKDGQIYHIIRAGQGVMGSYANQITDPKARWAVVNYVRVLQKK